MWNEHPQETAFASLREQSLREPSLHPALVEEVKANSIGEDLGFQPGDKLLSINGKRPRDLIDYKYLIAEELLELEIIDQNDKLHTIQLDKNLDDDLGLVFTEALFDGLKQCNNHCPFCFIDQQPDGHRNTLYLKDDDYRMSFLYGSYLTLTNLKQKDWQRIEQQRLSPLFVSVHATNSNLRAKLLKNKRAGLIMEQIQWFSERKLQLHAQIVVCPNLNDSENLENTLNDLFFYAHGEWPTVISAAVVPVGLTKFRPAGDDLKPVNKLCAKKVIHLVEKLQRKYHAAIGKRFAWLSDEWYLISHQRLPSRMEYEDFPQEENGVGSIRSFLENMEKATSKLPERITKKKRSSWVVGKLVEKALDPIAEKMNQIDGLSLRLYGLKSPYWGKDNVVTGLLTGQDIINGLQNKELGEELLLPSIMLKNGEQAFLDDMTVEEVEKTLQITIKIIYSPDDFVNTLINS